MKNSSLTRVKKLTRVNPTSPPPQAHTMRDDG